LQLERVVLGRWRLEGIALVGNLRRPLVESGDVTADRRRAAAQQEAQGRCRRDHYAFHEVLHLALVLIRCSNGFLQATSLRLVFNFQ
jgi:hypothetical protein